MKVDGEFEVVVYAVGGGFGHAVRGSLLHHVLLKKNIRSVLVMRTDSCPKGYQIWGPSIEIADGKLPDFISGHTLIMDTFPNGWRNGLAIDEQLYRFSRRILVARAVGNGVTPLWGTETFDEILVPYPSGLSEWKCAFPRSSPIGFTTRAIDKNNRMDDKTVAVVDFGDCIRPQFKAVLEKCADLSRTNISIFDSTSYAMFSALRFRKCLYIGAGYNTFYESLRMAEDALFLPLSRQFDNQFSRAKKWSKLADSPDAILSWLKRERSHEGALTHRALLPSDFEFESQFLARI
jgi:hypothetical protein